MTEPLASVRASRADLDLSTLGPAAPQAPQAPRLIQSTAQFGNAARLLHARLLSPVVEDDAAP